jgi:arylsulfatase A-like enzyme
MRPHQHVDGLDLSPILTGAGSLRREALFWHYPHFNQHPESFPSGVIRQGDWKLIEAYESNEVSLFNLADDVGETKNRAGENPAKVKELQEALARWRHDVDADPMRPNPQYHGSRK